MDYFSICTRCNDSEMLGELGKFAGHQTLFHERWVEKETHFVTNIPNQGMFGSEVEIRPQKNKTKAQQCVDDYNSLHI